MKLINITLAELLRMTKEESYIYYYSYRFGHTLKKAHNHYEFKPLRDYTFGQVKNVQYSFSKEIAFREVPEILSILEKDDMTYFNGGVFEVFQQLAWLKKQIEEINNIERQTLVRKQTSKEIKAGVDRFEQFGNYPQLRAIAQTFNKDIAWAENISYNDGYLELYYQKELDDYKYEYSKIKD